ncbi:MAG: hypothetical protein LBC98_07070 [Prevotellaceae bacterium]|jgi:hypothetical protein|nr:hypothetical protein [Prevotellaceae bacterium]
MNTPILFLIFNRPDTTAQVFERIRQAQPARLYVAADGAREGRPDEAKRCAETRSVIDRIDWPCKVKTLFRDKNLGCKIAVSEAITWFFDNEQYGIILEDDCLPDMSFFPFCEELLIRYKDDDRIGHIGGNCFFPCIVKDRLSYDFCNHVHIWGWASWRRVWQNYDVEFQYWSQHKYDSEKHRNIFNCKREEIYFSSALSDAISTGGKLNTWDYQYFFTLRTQNQLSVYPCVNLVTNIGLDAAMSTNTNKNTRNSGTLSTMAFPLRHPQYIIRNKTIDNAVLNLKWSWKRLLRYLFKQY